MDLSKELNLVLAWKRYKRDLQDMAFCDHPYETKIIDNNLEDWVSKLQTKLQNYDPSRCEIVNVPKKGFHLRPGSILTPADATIYHALLLKELSKIQKELLWSAVRERCSYILTEDQTTTNLFVNEYKGWSRFRETSLSYIDKGYEWVVFADISGYFENISIQRLISDLRAFGLTEEILKYLSKCLNRWAEPRSRGIPQGNRCSFILGEVYLNSIDKRLKNNKLEYCRYVDDIRIFCKSKGEAISALHGLTILLREKELNLQTTKSYIKNGKEAREIIDNVSSIIQATNDKLIFELKELLMHEMEYATPLYIEKGLASIGEDIYEFEVVHEIFDEYIKKKGMEFDKTIFHYCINRLAAARDNYGIEHCMSIILDRPEEFINIIPYFNKLVDDRARIIESLIQYFVDNKNVLDRQYFLLLRWIYNEKCFTEKVVNLCRDLSVRSGLDNYTKYYAWAILGECGDSADLDSIESGYNKANDELGKATIICAIKRMVEDRRNSVYSRAMGDGDLVKYAIKASKN
ncbi:MAG: RNA-directed DNA polymerase [Candidatus Marinimicrobia bacterium]|nr:RNA-directed DNA polymerase [Candidatus Neomarinimicrobiota bacterium]